MIFIVPLVLASTTLNLPAFDPIAATTLSFDSIEQAPEAPEASEQAQANTLATSWGKEGSRRWGIQGGYAQDVKDSDNEVITLGVEFEFFIEDNLSIDVGLLAMGVDQTGDNARGLNATLQLRWHFSTHDTWSMFIEGGAGLLRTSDNVPTLGSRFNFTPQAGIGWTFDLGNKNRWILGLRWHHISNANLYSSNPGRDSIMVWTGISFPF